MISWFCRKSERSEQHSHRQLTRTVNSYIYDIFGIDFVLEPCTTVRNDCSTKACLAILIQFFRIIDRRASDKLRDDNTFSTIDDESTCDLSSVGSHP